MTDEQRDRARKALELAIDEVGGASRLAEKLEITRGAVYQWDVCPADRCVDVEKHSGIPRTALRPDVFR
ncbi:MAG: CI repressor [Anaerolineae bacterium]|nr:CI repressor [Anaerolineae bacterium]NIN96112.1 CI repressor [Anaerolineae bacterium]NIQ80532.1 CI repressor [Anaerolineae bacterium]